MPLNCCYCKILYYKKRTLVKRESLYYECKYNYCTSDCHNKSRVVSSVEPCKNCNNLVTRIPSEKRKSKNVFCNRSCAASYNNKHKQYGTRRSKLEQYLEAELRSLYPNLKIIVNSKKEIDSELDFYFPELKFAVELNGPTHYEPIYGQEKFERITLNDRQKIIKCFQKGIELLVIDVSKVSYLTEERKRHYLGIFKEHLDKLQHRLE